jgi:hypothetical protein
MLTSCTTNLILSKPNTECYTLPLIKLQ